LKGNLRQAEITAQSFSPERAFFDLSDRVKLRVRGNDRLRFLNGQLTNDVRKATEASAIGACVLNAKGKLDAHVFLTVEPEAFLLDADAELKKSLQPRLERYIIADDVQIEDVTDRLSIFHVLNARSPELPRNSRIISANRFGESGSDIWVEANQHDQLFQQWSAALTFCDADCAEALRIEQGIPRWGRELTGEIIPVEANLEERCIDYEKGCYIGQETISRMKMSGQTNKRLCGLVSVNDSPLLAGMKLFPMGEEKKEAGWVTSATHSERLGKKIALGFVKRGFNVPGANLDALASENLFGSAAARVEIVDLPFGR
jgi:folate-binding protein YgfZ